MISITSGFICLLEPGLYIRCRSEAAKAPVLITEPWALAQSGPQAKACGPDWRATEAPAGVLVQYVEEAEGAQRSQDG